MDATRGRLFTEARASIQRDAWSEQRLPIHDARNVPDGSVLDYDVCIVGTGAAGCTAALSLVGHGLRIAVLESGGEVRDEVTSAFTAVDWSGSSIDDDCRGRWLGGTTNMWTGGMTTLDAIDLRGRAWVPNSGWPIDAARLRSCYERAAALFGYPDPGYFDSAGDGGGGLRFDSDVLRTLVFQKDRPPRRFGDELRSRLSAADGVHLITLANATSIELDESGARVGGIEVQTLLGARFRVRCAVAILACGAIENARLLLASRSARAAGLGNDRDVVGRYLQDHPKGFTAELLLDGRRLPARPYWPTRTTSRSNTRWGIGLTEIAQERRATLNSYLRLEPIVVGDPPRGIQSLRAVARGRVRAVDAGAFLGLLSERDVLRQMARFRYGNKGPIDSILVRTFMEQAPVSTNRVHLSDRSDPLGHPLAAVDSTLSDLDIHSVHELHRALGDDIRERGIGELRCDLDDESLNAAVTDASHQAGTTRMGVDPTTSVTDPTGEVHSVPGLFMTGASLFPTSGYANPVFSILATTIHVVDHVLDRIGSSSPVVAEPESDITTAAGIAEAKRWLGGRRRARHPLPRVSRSAAVIWSSPQCAELVPIEVASPTAGQVSVLVEASAVSAGTERARWLGLPGAAIRYPHFPGYSLAGSVLAVGPGVYDILPGDRVAVWGAPHQSLVTVRRRQVLALHEHTDVAEAAMITLGAIAALGVARAGDLDGRSIAVIGAGAIGLLAHRMSIAGGADRAIVIAASNAKDVFVRAGCDVSLRQPRQVDGVDADIVIEATGAAEGLDYALRAAGAGATVVLLGTTRAESVDLPLDLIAARGLRLVGAHAGLLDAPGGTDGLDRISAAQQFLDLIEAGTVRVDDLVTSRVDPLEIESMYERLASDRRCVVPVIEWWRLAPELRIHEGPLKLPNPARRGLTAPARAIRDHAGGVAPIVEHPRAPLRTAMHHSAVEIERAGLIADQLSAAGPRDTIFVDGPVAPIEIDVQTLIHKRGTTVVGEPTKVDRPMRTG
jgi:2-desacetyl-2-hydroxyethyl bacteriochlorophyllide A dehydrogenase